MSGPIARSTRGYGLTELRLDAAADAVVGRGAVGIPGLAELAPGLDSEDKLLRARTCMTLEVLSRNHPALVAQLAARLVGQAEVETVPQARWHLAEVFGHIELAEELVERVVPALLGYVVAFVRGGRPHGFVCAAPFCWWASIGEVEMRRQAGVGPRAAAPIGAPVGERGG